MRYEDFVVGQKYIVLKDPEEMNQGYYQGDFDVGDIVTFKAAVEMIHECYTILQFEDPGYFRMVKFSLTLPEPDWSQYFRKV